jgi:hypothetical protein
MSKLGKWLCASLLTIVANAPLLAGSDDADDEAGPYSKQRRAFPGPPWWRRRLHPQQLRWPLGAPLNHSRPGLRKCRKKLQRPGEWRSGPTLF